VQLHVQGRLALVQDRNGGRIGLVAEAKKQYEDVRALAPNRFPQARYNYGVILLKQRSYREAEKAFRKALHIKPVYPEARLDLVLLC
jgi:tetratricopeptide (TPR) repeat protein